MVAPGNCTLLDNQCHPNTFCPSLDDTEVACEPCESITKGNSCVCQKNKLQLNCKSCNGIFCQKCIKGQTVAFGQSCRHCTRNCLECSEAHTCDVCENGYFFNGVTCQAGCNTTDDCPELGTFCDIKTSSCKSCAAGCVQCESPETCSTCLPGLTLIDGQCIEYCDTTSDCRMKPGFCNNSVCQDCVPGCEECSSSNICYKCKDGMFMNAIAQCEVECPELKNGQFCQNGSPMPCVEGLTSFCKCEAAENCAYCSADGNSCAECYPGFVMDNGQCQPCSKGYDWYQGLCLMREYTPLYASNGTTSNIAGAAVAGLIVAAGVCGGLAFYLTRKYRNNYARVNTIAE